VEISLGSATSLPQIGSGTITAVVVDPPYADNVQYSELADFFYVWLKRTQGHRRPEWFSTYLCEHDQEAVVNISRHRENGAKPTKKGKRDGSTKEAKAKAHTFYQGLMTDVFKESRRILRDDGVLTVMFTHKKQEAWEALFTSLIKAGFTITATWPVKTESEHSLHQAKKNAAQSTVILVARKRPRGAGVGYFDSGMQEEIRDHARGTAERLQREGLNPVDQLVGSFGPAMEVYSRYDEVKTDTGVPVGVDKAIDIASDAVSAWRVEQLAERGLESVEAEGRFALLCWDVLGAAEFRFNEAKLLGHAVGMDIEQLVGAGLVTKSGDKIQMLPAKERRRDRALEPDEITETLFGPVTTAKRRTKKDALKVHPNDAHFRTALDACHVLALRYLEAGGGAGGIGSAKALIRQQHWSRDSAVARLMEALVHAAPAALRHEKGKQSAAAKFPEFPAWHALLDPLFGIQAPDWTEKAPPQRLLFAEEAVAEEEEEYDEETDEDEETPD
jgi:adenine-specific DNA methylase